MSFTFFNEVIEQRKSADLYRKRISIDSNHQSVIEIDGQHYLNFSSNDYLGLSQDPQILQTYSEGLALYGSGSGASPVVTGYTSEHRRLEELLCDKLNMAAAMLFSSGFSANQALCHALFNQQNKEGKILCDKYMHASFIQGAIETGVKLHRYKHNDIEHAQSFINQLPANSLIATEGVFSMDGDLGDVGSLVNIKKQVNDHAKTPWLMVDDAHAIGVTGNNGFGTLDGPLVGQVDVLIGTFGKALGTNGAFIAGSKTFIDYMINTSKHYIYSTAFSAAQARATQASLLLVEQGEQREKLCNNIQYFRQQAKSHGLNVMASESAIQGIIIGNPKRCVDISKELARLGLWVAAIRAPTVPKNTDRLRITLSSLHSQKDIQALLDALSMVINKG